MWAAAALARLTAGVERNGLVGGARTVVVKAATRWSAKRWSAISRKRHKLVVMRVLFASVSLALVLLYVASKTGADAQDDAQREGAARALARRRHRRRRPLPQPLTDSLGRDASCARCARRRRAPLRPPAALAEAAARTRAAARAHTGGRAVELPRRRRRRRVARLAAAQDAHQLGLPRPRLGRATSAHLYARRRCHRCPHGHRMALGPQRVPSRLHRARRLRRARDARSLRLRTGVVGPHVLGRGQVADHLRDERLQSVVFATSRRASTRQARVSRLSTVRRGLARRRRWRGAPSAAAAAATAATAVCACASAALAARRARHRCRPTSASARAAIAARASAAFATASRPTGVLTARAAARPTLQAPRVALPPPPPQ